MAIHHAKDNSFKAIFSEPELFAEFLKDYIKIDIFKDITPDDIEDISERFIPLFQDSRDSDTVKRINLKGTPLYVIALLEHESKVNHRTSFKMLQYITLALTEYEKEANKENKNASKAKSFKYPPVLPIVFYDGTGKWTAEREFLKKTELSDVFYKYIPKFEYELISLRDYSEEDITQFGNTLSLIMLIDKLQSAGSGGIMEKLPSDYFEKLGSNVPENLRELLGNVATILLKRINAPDDEINKFVDYINEGRYQDMFSGWDNYDVQKTRKEAREEGREEGRREGIIETARRFLMEGLSAELVARATQLSIEEVRDMQKGASFVNEDTPEYKRKK